MDAQQALQAQRRYINELLHRMTVAETRGARLYLVAETKRAIDELESMLLARAAGTHP